MKKASIIIAAVAICVLAFAGGFYFGNKKGEKEGEEKIKSELAPIVELAFPKPAEKITNLAGVVKEIYGATVYLEVADPNDYLPHIDGSPRKKQIRLVSVSKATEIVSVALDKNGNVKSAPLKFSDLKKGDKVAVRSSQNIKDAEKFDAKKIELLKY